MTSLLDQLNWRYATKKYDPSKKVPADKLDRILEAVRLAPTSSGLQPFELIVVSNPEIREKIKAIGYQQQQIVDSSHLLVFAAWDQTTPERINMMFDLANDIRQTANEGWENYRQMLLDIVATRGAEVNFQFAARQAYIALGFALVAAAAEEVDATPMEGFDPDALDEILQLRQRGLRSVVILPVGYRDEAGDWLVGLKKVRRSRDALISEIA
ncbi:NAD(P)H-dependent oxidoreductase [Mitsuaria sp. 7]|uniref:NAD(P)H-dependent oxidoreductase n=1 Tax=Mitsuaria sp. 7 TaxID=1658665 RepID=UPI0007DCF825|nr:NAD(P)H-dependent oxidoreductase [Mitsuaria sp. 7]ANH66578.1 nitroreductase [Mitsuaria sp. 7]